MYKYLILIMGILLQNTINAQHFNLKLHKSSINDIGFYVPDISSKNIKTRNIKDSLIVLNDSCNLFNYQILDYCIQSKNINNKYDSIKILVGLAKKSFVIVCDKNRNANFKDDKVYKITINPSDKDIYKYYENLPLIEIDSVRLLKKGVYIFEKLQFKASPYFFNDNYYRDTSENVVNKSYVLQFINRDYYYSDDFVYNNYSYKLIIKPRPLLFSVYPLENSMFSGASVNLIKLNTQKDGVYVGNCILENNLHNKEPLRFDSNALYISNTNFDTFDIDLIIEQAKDEINKDFFTNKHLYNVKTSIKENPFSLTKTKYTIIEFSGTWCKGCLQIDKKMEALNTKLSSSFNLITIMEDYNIQVVKSFIKKQKVQRKIYFEKIGEKNFENLSNILGIDTYPAFIIISNSTQKVIYKKTGANNFTDLLTQLKKLEN